MDVSAGNVITSNLSFWRIGRDGIGSLTIRNDASWTKTTGVLDFDMTGGAATSASLTVQDNAVLAARLVTFGGAGGDATFSLSGNAQVSMDSSITISDGDGDEAVSISGGSLTAPTLTISLDGPGAGADSFSYTGGDITAGHATVNLPGSQVFTVANNSTLSLGDGGTHLFTDGLTIASDGTLGTGNNSATKATIDNSGGAATFTLANGATIDYSINGDVADASLASDTFTFLSNSNFGTAPTALNLIVDVVAGDVKQTAGPFPIFDFGGAAPAGWDSIEWTITAGDGTRLSSPGSVIVGDGSNGLAVGEIGLSGFEAFAIPEPSTAMLLGMGAMVMLLRRCMR